MHLYFEIKAKYSHSPQKEAMNVQLDQFCNLTADIWTI